MDEKQLAVAAFAKWVNGEHLGLRDAQRVWQTVLAHGLKIDTADENAKNSLLSEVKGSLQRIFFS
jgi:hypothetical protein